MSLFLLVSHLIDGVAGHAVILPLVITIGAFFFEDGTAVVVGLLAADGVVAIPIALFSIFIGIVLGDSWLYFIGWLASGHPRFARYVEHDFLAPFRLWIDERFVTTVFSARFIPGSRMLTYISTGFFRSKFSKFLLTAIAAASVWTTLLFSASYLFGSITSRWLGPVRWGIACAFIITFFFIGRRNLLAYRARKNSNTK